MRSSKEFVAHVKDLLEEVPRVRVRAMFGGHGVFRDGLMFALVSDDQLYFRADGARGEALRLKGSAQFQPDMRGRKMSMPYYRAPDVALDDPDLACSLAKESFADALSTDQTKPKSKRKHKPAL